MSSGSSSPILIDREGRWMLGTLRLFMGWFFLWPFMDKLLGLGFTTEAADAWIRGGSPTFGFLTFGTAGPFAEFYGSIAGAPLANWLFMLGLLGVGIGMTLGIGVRISGIVGAIMTFLMWTAYLPPEHNPIVDEHLLESIALLLLAATPSGHVWGLGKWWESQTWVQRYRWLI